MSALTHYIVVRRDLPLGVMAAQIAHAAGESFYRLGSRSSGSERSTFSREAGSSPLPGSSSFAPDQTIAIVLGARNEGKLARLERALLGADIPHVAIREVDGMFTGCLMAIGLVPGEKTRLAPWVNEFHMLPESPSSGCARIGCGISSSEESPF